MCGGPKFTPPPVDPAAEAEAADRREALANQKMDAQNERAEDKRRRTGDAAARAMGSFGMRSLISGSRGGAGFGRSLLG
jgi:hypothetical protein